MALFQEPLQALLAADLQRISPSGKHLNRGSLPGLLLGGRDAPGGISSAP